MILLSPFGVLGISLKVGELEMKHLFYWGSHCRLFGRNKSDKWDSRLLCLYKRLGLSSSSQCLSSLMQIESLERWSWLALCLSRYKMKGWFGSVQPHNIQHRSLLEPIRFHFISISGGLHSPSSHTTLSVLLSMWWQSWAPWALKPAVSVLDVKHSAFVDMHPMLPAQRLSCKDSQTL